MHAIGHRAAWRNLSPDPSPAKGNAVVLLLVVLCLLNVPLGRAQTSGQGEEVTYGVLRTLHSDILSEERTYSLRLPSEYESSSHAYPVLLLLDGEMTNRFVLSASIATEMMYAGQVPEMIIVGLHNTDRARDMLPEPLGPRAVGGGAEAFLRFLTQELLPHLDATYRTVPFRILMGHSNSGLFAAYAFLAAPEAFQRVIASSPMMAYGEQTILTLTEERGASAEPHASSIFLIHDEQDLDAVLDGVPPFLAALAAAPALADRWSHLTVAGEGHVPYSSIHHALSAFFPDWQPPEEQAFQLGLDGLREHYQTLGERYGFRARIPDDLLLGLAYDQLTAEAYREARTTMAHALERDPDWTLMRYLYAVLHERTGERDEAIAQCERILATDPQDQRERQLRDRLRGEPAPQPD